MGTGVRTGIWFVVTSAALALGKGAVNFSNPTFVPTLIKTMIGLGAFIVALDVYGIVIAVRRTPIPAGVRLLEGLRRSLSAYNSRGAWSARHPWLMTAITLAVWAAASFGAAARFAFYSSH